MGYVHLTDDSFNPGAVQAPPDARAIEFARAVGAGAISVPVIDWDTGYEVPALGAMPISDQGPSSSCVGQSWRNYAQALDYLENGTLTRLSARDIYARIRLSAGGAYIEDGARLLTRRGICEYDAAPDDPAASEETMSRLDDITPEEENRALRYKAKSYASVAPDIETAAQAIATGYGAVTGVIGSNLGWREPNGIVRPPLSGEKQWGHAVYACGYGMIGGKRAIKFRNSWSAAWGASGSGWLAEDYFANGTVFGFTTLVDLPDDWLDAVHAMLNIIKEPGTPHLWVVGRDGKRYKLTDEETWNMLKAMGAVPEIVASPDAAQFAAYPDGGLFPSKKLMDAVGDVAVDVFSLT